MRDTAQRMRRKPLSKAPYHAAFKVIKDAGNKIEQNEWDSYSTLKGGVAPKIRSLAALDVVVSNFFALKDLGDRRRRRDRAMMMAFTTVFEYLNL